MLRKRGGRARRQGIGRETQVHIVLVQERFKYDGSGHACHPKSLTGKDARTLRMLSKWVDKFTTLVKKIDCRVVLTADAESPAALTGALGRFLFSLSCLCFFSPVF